MQKEIKKILWMLLGTVCFATQIAAADMTIRGIVTDPAGRPIRGATVRAVLGDKAISRFSQKDGKYELSVPAGNYEVTVDAYGFALKSGKKDTAEAGDLNFQLSPGWSSSRLSGAEVSAFLPENQEADAIRTKCIGCHSLRNPELHRGWTAQEFSAWLHVMFRRKDGLTFDGILNKPEAFDTLVNLLAKYFGPGSVAPTPETVKHLDVSDDALNATFVEYSVDKGFDPTAAHPFIAGSDSKRGIVWFSNQKTMIRFNMKTEKIDYFPDGDAHGILLDKDGGVWAASERNNFIIHIDPDTGALKTYNYEDDYRLLGGQKVAAAGGHFVAFDQTGHLWMASWDTPKLYEFTFNGEKMEMQTFDNAPVEYDKPGMFIAIPGEKPDPPGTGFNLNSSYDVMVDSKGVVWRTQTYTRVGRLLAFDPKVGKDKAYVLPINVAARGITIDPQDNIWFSVTAPGTSTTLGAHGIGKFDQKTQKFTFYQPPTKYAAGYGIFYDKNTGYIWWPDLNGGNIDRFDPKTEKFVEFPVPDHAMQGGYLSTDDQGRVAFAEIWNQKIGILDPGESAGHRAR